MNARNLWSRTGVQRRMGVGLMLLGLAAGCYVPLVSYGVPARELPETFRIPLRQTQLELNYSYLTVPAPPAYVLGPNDVLDVTIPKLYELAETRPQRVTVLPDGRIHLPMVGGVEVGGLTLPQAQEKIRSAYVPDYLNEATVSLTLADKAAVNVLVLGQVLRPGVYLLPKYENDVGHALALAGGLTPDAGDAIEVHRRSPVPPSVLPPGPVPVFPPEPVPVFPPGPVAPVPGALPPDALRDQLRDEAKKLHEAEQRLGISLPFESPAVQELVQTGVEVDLAPGPDVCPLPPNQVVRIPLRTHAPVEIAPQDITLHSGDVVVVPRKVDQVFYVVGRLSAVNFVRFSVTEEQRELGTGFLLPRNRDIDVVEAVTMAGYIDPISSPSTVTVHRTLPDGQPFLILVDLIKARYDARENLFVHPGDIIYLNPDPAWYFRIIFNDIVSDLLVLPYDAAVGANRN